MALTTSTPVEIGYAVTAPTFIPIPPFTPVPIFGTGLLSRAIQHLQGSIQALLTLTELPVEAHNKLGSMIPVLATELLKITAIQPVVNQFVVDAMPGLQQAKVNLETNTNLDQVVTTITRTSTLASALKQRVDALSADIHVVNTQIIDLKTSLAPLQKQNHEQQIRLKGELQTIEAELHNPWSVLGDKITGRYNQLINQVQRIESNLVSLTRYDQSLGTMINDFAAVTNQIGFVGNAVHIVASDDSQVINDLKNTQGDQLIAKIYLTTTISQLQTLETDAS